MANEVHSGLLAIPERVTTEQRIRGCKMTARKGEIVKPAVGTHDLPESCDASDPPILRSDLTMVIEMQLRHGSSDRYATTCTG